MTQEISCDGVDENTTQEWNYSVLREQFERIENSLQRYLRAVHQRVEEYSHKTQETMLSTLQMDISCVISFVAPELFITPTLTCR